jgi:hypothetical protein
MEWISVDERTPKPKQIVLVIGDFNTISSTNILRKEKGFVSWSDSSESPCVNQGFYYLYFTNITHWCEIPEQPKQN